MQRCTFARLSRTLAVLTLAVFSLLLAASRTFAVTAPGFIPAPGFAVDGIGLAADTFTLSPDGRLAIGVSSSAGATITVFNHADPVGRRVLGVFGSPTLRNLGGLAFAGPDTLLVSENGAQDTVLAIHLGTGSVRPLAPAGSIPNVAQVRVRPSDGGVFAVAANPPGQGAIYRIADGAAIPFATNIGTGYLGGLTFDGAGNLLVADTNDPDFTGRPGQVLSLNAAGQRAGALSLAGGQGSGAYDVARDAFGALYATTGATVTRVLGGKAHPLGQFVGDFPFPTDIAVDSSGVLVNGIFTEVGGLFRIRPARGAFRQPIQWTPRPVARPTGRR